jgi:cysteine-rich repeat protein
VTRLGAALAVALAVTGAAAAPPQHPFPQHVPLAPGTITPTHRSQATLDDDARALYDAWKSRYLAQAGTESDGHPRYRVRTGRGANKPTVSEGQGWGMILAALMAGHDPGAQTIFDGLWEYRLDHPSTIDARLMDWHVKASEAPDASGNDSAFDGDADMAFALLLAEQQWGNGGRFDYRAAALTTIGGIRDSTIGPTTLLPMLGDWVDPGGTPYSEHTPRTSDFMLDNFRAWSRATGDPVWANVVTAAQAAVTHVQTTHSPVTGLLPDFLEPVSATDPTLRPASPGFLEGPNDGFYYYNAVRDPLRLGLDAALNGDAVSRAQVRKVSAWYRAATGGSPAGVRAGRRLDGTLLQGNDYFTTVFVASVGVAAMSEPEEGWLNALYDAVRLSDEDYYEDTVSLLCLLAMTGNYWNPALVAGGATTTTTTSTTTTLPAPCGNGLLDPGEQCDDGNTAGGDCCSPACLHEAPGVPCDDANACTAPGACDGAGLCVPGPCRQGVACGVVCGTTLRCTDVGGPCACRAP